MGLHLRLGLGNQPVAGGGTPPATNTIYVLLNIGQSNERGTNDGTGAPVGAFDSDPRILQIPANPADGDAITLAVEKLRYDNTPISDPDRSYIMPLAKALLPTLGANDRIIIVPLAIGGTSYSANGGSRWAVGGDLYLRTISRILTLKTAIAAAYPGFAIEWGFTGAPGENDVSFINHTAYVSLQVASFQGIMAAADIPNAFIVSTLMSPGWVAQTVGGNAINSAKLRLREMLPRTVIIAAPDGPYDAATGNIHFAAGAQFVRGQDLAARVAAARARTAPFNPRVNFLDGITGTYAGAYSLYRRLFSAYAGAAFRVRRLSDNAEQDIGFVGNIVDFAAFNTFIGSADAVVAVWYDQSGLGRNFVANAADVLPRIATAGQMIWRNGRPVMGGNNGSMIATYEMAAAGTMIVSGQFAVDGTRAIISSRGGTLSHSAGLYQFALNNVTQNAGFTVTAGMHTMVGRPQTGNLLAHVDGVEQTLSAAAAFQASYAGVTTLLARQTTNGGAIASRSNSLISEVIMADTALDRAQVHAATVSQYFPD